MKETTATTKTQYANVASWELSESLWERLEPLLPQPKSRYRGRGATPHRRPPRSRCHARTVMSGILYVMRSGCQWNAMPEEYGWVTTAAPLLPTAVVIGVFKRMWQAGLSEPVGPPRAAALLMDQSFASFADPLGAESRQ